MKWLYEFVVVRERALTHALQHGCAAVVEGHGRVRTMEELIAQAIENRLDDVSFYRRVLELRVGVHRELAFWIVSRMPAVFTDWRLYVTYGVLCVSAASLRGRRLAIAGRKDIAKAVRGLDATDADAFLEAWQDALAATIRSGGCLAMTARMLAGT